MLYVLIFNLYLLDNTLEKGLENVIIQFSTGCHGVHCFWKVQQWNTLYTCICTSTIPHTIWENHVCITNHKTDPYCKK